MGNRHLNKLVRVLAMVGAGAAMLLANAGVAAAATTIGTNISTDGSLTVVGNSTFGTVIAGTWNGTPIGNAYLGSGIDAAKLADGSVSNAEFQYLGNVTSDIQAQLDGKASLASVANAANWDAAYGWGNHAAQGYLKSYTETDPVFGASAAKNILAADITNWNAAYGWGNHAGLYSLVGHTHAGTYEPANANIQSHIVSSSNPHGVTAAQVGLGSVENTALSTWAGSSNITTVGALASASGNVSLWTNDAGYITAAGVPAAETDPQVGALTASKWCAADGTGSSIVCSQNAPVLAESDPVFSAHAASGVTSGKISNWDAAYGWGNHATQGYLSSSTSAGGDLTGAYPNPTIAAGAVGATKLSSFAQDYGAAGVNIDLSNSNANGSTILTVDGLNISKGYVRHSVGSITAFNGGGQANATPMNFEVNNVNSATQANDSVALPPAQPNTGMVVYVANNSGFTVMIWPDPSSGDVLNGAVQSFSLLANEGAVCFATTKPGPFGAWNCIK